jgi:hypothetical protein
MSDDPRAFITPEELARRWHDERELAARHYGIPWPPPPWEESSEDYRATSLWAASKVIDWLRAREEHYAQEHYAQGYAAARAALTEETIPKLNALMERLLGRLDAMEPVGKTAPEESIARAPCSQCRSVMVWGDADLSNPFRQCQACEGDS